MILRRLTTRYSHQASSCISPAHAEVIVIPIQQHSDNLTPYTNATRHSPRLTTHTRHTQTAAFSPGCTCMPAFPSVIRPTKEDSDARSASTPMLSSSSRQDLSSPELLSPPMVGGDLLEFYTSGILLLLISWFNPSSRQFPDDLHCCVQYYI